MSTEIVAPGGGASAPAPSATVEAKEAAADEGLWAKRHRERLQQIPALYKTRLEQLAFELALRLDDPDTIFERHGYDKDGALRLLDQPGFAELLVRVEKEVMEQGLTFTTKARVIAEDLLPQAYEIATDQYQPANVRADIIKWFAKVANLEPKDPKDGGAQARGGFSLSITFAQAPANTGRVVNGQVIDVEVLPAATPGGGA